MRLQGKTAMVTGGASGFGRGIAETFGREGANVVILDLNQAGAQEVASSISNHALAIEGDVTKKSDIERAVAQTVEQFGRLDIVVNNAGWTHVNQPMLEVDEDEFDRVFNINVKSIYLMTHAVVPSTAGIRPRPGLTWYNGSKGAVNLMSRSMAVELAPDRIRVNAVAPVMGESAMLERFMGLPDTPENRAKFVAGIPLGRMSKPSDVANACLYLASDEAEFITGVVLEVDGGRTI
ncbi:MAG: glucose 1-dehydrogenase [Rhizobiales bacterium]|nr:glucose 1-dehydrogenase [Hyphomicrobiales bacterium]